MATDFANARLVENLRFRWRDALASYSDKAIIACYDDFALSEDWGNNDEKFPDWIPLIKEYEHD